MEETKGWLNEVFFRLILNSSDENVQDRINNVRDGITITDKTNEEDLVIVDYKVKRLTGEGKDLTSTVYKVKLLYMCKTDEIKRKNYAVKKLNLLAPSWFGNKETDIYKALPKLEQFVNIKITPKMYFCSEHELVMEDLNEKSFNTVTKLLGYEHCELALKALAKFHAASVVLHQEDPKLVEEKLGFEVVFFSAFDFISYYEKSLFILAEIISTWPESKKYSHDMKIISSKVKGFFENLPNRKSLKVLNHGDFWVPNLMFRYDSGKVTDVKFVDFQMSRYSPPTFDIHFFIASSADLDVRVNRLDDLYSAYLETLNSTLSDLGVPQRMTKQQFDKSIKEDYIVIFTSIVGPLCIFLADPGNDLSLDGLDELKVDDCVTIFKSCFNSKRFRSFLPSMLDDLNNRGVFEQLVL